MLRADSKKEIFRNKQAAFWGTPLSQFQPIRAEITGPFTQNIHFHFVVSSRHHCTITYVFDQPMRLQAWNDW